MIYNTDDTHKSVLIGYYVHKGRRFNPIIACQWKLSLATLNRVERRLKRKSMRFNFRKIAALAMGALTVGMTAGIAAAATYPAPFVSGGTGNVAVVYGTGTGVSSLDLVQAGNIQTNLQGFVTTTGGSTTTVSGEHVVLQQPSSYLTLGNGVANVFARAVTKTDMPTLLADGTFKDNASNDHDYTQKINVSNLKLNSFNLEDYDSNVSTSTPTIGFNISTGGEENVLNYTLTFQSPVDYNKLADTNLNIMGKSYYISKADNASNTLTLLDSADSASLSQGGTVTIGNHTVTATYIDSSKNVKFTVDGTSTSTLTEGDTYKLPDGSYLVVKSVLAQGYSGGVSNVDFAIGNGKIVLDGSGNDITVNSNSVSGMKSTITKSGVSKISSITIEWDTSDAAAITPSHSMTMPAFAGVALTFGGMSYPANETTTVSNDGNTAVKLSTTVQNGPVILDILGLNRTSGNYVYIGKDSNNLLKTAASTSLLNVARNNEFVVSGNSGKVSESHVYKVTSFSNTTSNGLQVVLTPQDGGSQVTLTNATGASVGIETGLTLTPTINYAAKLVNFSVSGTGATFGTLYTADGLKIALPTSGVVNDTKTGNVTGVSSYDLNFTEADGNVNIGKGHSFQLTLGHTGSAGSFETTVTHMKDAGTSVNGIEIGNSNVYVYNIPSVLASTINYDQGPTQETATVNYYGTQSSSVNVAQSYGQLILASPSAVVTSGGSSTGVMLVKDSEVSSVSSDNLIVVGGSCINSVAANLVGGAYCGSSFTSATGVGSGQFLIKSYTSPYNSGKIALLVAGYEAADTTNAGQYLINHPQGAIDTSKTYIGTTSTSASTSVA